MQICRVSCGRILHNHRLHRRRRHRHRHRHRRHYSPTNGAQAHPCMHTPTRRLCDVACGYALSCSPSASPTSSPTTSVNPTMVPTQDPYCDGQYYEVGDLPSLMLAVNRTTATGDEKNCIRLMSGEILINNGANITLDGNGVTIIKGTGESRLFQVENATLNLMGITVMNGFDHIRGGCIAVDNGVLTMHENVVSHCGTFPSPTTVE